MGSADKFLEFFQLMQKDLAVGVHGEVDSPAWQQAHGLAYLLGHDDLAYHREPGTHNGNSFKSIYRQYLC